MDDNNEVYKKLNSISSTIHSNNDKDDSDDENNNNNNNAYDNLLFTPSTTTNNRYDLNGSNKPYESFENNNNDSNDSDNGYNGPTILEKVGLIPYSNKKKLSKLSTSNEDDTMVNFNPNKYTETIQFKEQQQQQTPILNTNIMKLHKKNSNNNISNMSNFSRTTPTIEKLNYIIKLLEEQQDNKTKHVYEEMAMFGFLGIFVIMMLDNCVRIGKYSR